MLDLLKENISWIKDLFTILFAATGTVLAILTYRRAKATVLQPKRSEVIKKQTQVLTDFLTVVSQNNNSLDSGLDYVNLLSFNVDLILREYGLMSIEKGTELYEKLDANIAGWIQFFENDLYKFVYIKGNLSDYDKIIFDVDNRQRQKDYSKKASEGEVIVHRIFFTHRHRDFFEALRDFWHSPFLPKRIHQTIEKIEKNISGNIHYDLRSILKTLVIESLKAMSKDSQNKIVLTHEYRHHTLFRLYENVRTQHEDDYQELKEQIRAHLEIDTKW